jgi:hypothetical protein
MAVSTASIAQAVAARQTPAERLFEPVRLGGIKGVLRSAFLCDLMSRWPRGNSAY